MASNGQPQGHTKGAPVPLAMHTKEQPPANANAHHNTITRATSMVHKAVPPQGMLKDRLAMPRYQSNWELACTIAMAKAGWVQHPIHQQANMHAPKAFSINQGQTPGACPQQ